VSDGIWDLKNLTNTTRKTSIVRVKCLKMMFLLRLFNENKMLTTKMIYKLVEGSDAEIAAAISILEKRGLIKDVAGGAWVRTVKENIQPL
jgi:hypothetical protein